MEFQVADERMRTKVKNATNEVLLQPDWGAIIEICDELNASPALCPAVSYAVLNRLQYKNPDVGVLALHLIEALVKNVPSFHPYANDRKFLDTMCEEIDKSKSGNQSSKSLLGKVFGGGPGPQENWRSNLVKQEKLLVIIESWGKAFANSQSFPNFRKVYQELKIRGYRFPQPLKDELAPVFTPASQGAEDGKVNVTDPTLVAHEGNVTLLHDILNASDPLEDLRHNTVIQDLCSLLKAAQTDVLKKVANNPGEGYMAQLLHINDEIVQVFQFYEDLLTGKVERAPSKLLIQGDPKSPSEEEATEEEDGEVSEESPQPRQGSYEVDILGLGIGPPAIPENKSRKVIKKVQSSSNGSDATGRKAASYASANAEVPRISPPPRVVKPVRKSSGEVPAAASKSSIDDDFKALAISSGSANAAPVKKSSNGGDDIFQLLGFDAVPSSTQNGNAAAAPEKKISKKKSSASKKKSNDDDDDFMSIALRTETPREAPKPRNPLDELFN